MNDDFRTRYVAALALAVSAGALGVSLATGCKGSPDGAETAEVQAAPESRRVAAAEPGSASGAKPASRSAEDVGADTKAGPARAAETDRHAEARTTPRAGGTATTSKDEGPTERGSVTIKRLVVASGIEEREPVGADPLKVGMPVFAFLEAENEGEDDGAVVVTFERSTTKVGHVELTVPGDAPRWRTWGKTRNISEAGEWEAVVRTKDGVELARTTFEIEPA